MALTEEPIATEWNSSLATLMRIDKLIQMSHQLRLGNTRTDEPEKAYMNILDALYVEVQAKLSKSEKEGIDRLRNQINSIKWGNARSLASPTRNTTSGIIPNPQCRRVWNTIYPIAKEYELSLMTAMDRHGMLLTNSKNTIQKFTG